MAFSELYLKYPNVLYVQNATGALSVMTFPLDVRPGIESPYVIYRTVLLPYCRPSH